MGTDNRAMRAYGGWEVGEVNGGEKGDILSIIQIKKRILKTKRQFRAFYLLLTRKFHVGLW